MKKIMSSGFRFMMERKSRALAAISATFLCVVSTSSSAYALTIASYPTITLTPQNVVDSMCDIVNWLFYILIVLSVIMVLVAGYLFVTAGDDTEKVSKARKTITYAAVAIFVALIAKGFPSLIASFIGASSGSLSC